MTDHPGWHDGSCCCNCKHLIRINKHPWNKSEGKGSINEFMGYGCTVFIQMNVESTTDDSSRDKSNVAIFYDNEHGICELHEPNHERYWEILSVSAQKIDKHE